MLVEPLSHRLSPVERETDRCPGRLSEEVDEPACLELPVEGSSELLSPTSSNSPRVRSLSEVDSEPRVDFNSTLTSEKSCEVPGPYGSDRIELVPRNKVQRNLINWDEKVSEWFRIIHVHDVGHTGLDRTTFKLFEIPEVQRLSLRGLLPKDLKARISKMIKSCSTCQKNAPLKPTTQASHFSCSVF